MQLAEWLKARGKTQGWLAAEVGCTQGRISQIARGGEASLTLAAKIEAATDHEVTMRDLVPEPAQ